MSVRDGVPLEEALGFVEAHPLVYLLARRSDGFPTGYAMTATVRDGGVEFSTYRASAKVRHLQREGVAGIVAVSKPGGEVLSATGPVVVVDGRRRLVPPAAEIRPAGSSESRPWVPPEVGAKVAARHEDGKRCVLRVTIERARFARALG